MLLIKQLIKLQISVEKEGKIRNEGEREREEANKAWMGYPLLKEKEIENPHPRMIMTICGKSKWGKQW